MKLFRVCWVCFSAKTPGILIDNVSKLHGETDVGVTWLFLIVSGSEHYFSTKMKIYEPKTETVCIE